MLDRLVICSIAATMGSMLVVSAHGQDSLRTVPMERYVEASMNDFKISIDYDLFFELMPETIEDQRIDSLEKVELHRQLTAMNDVGRNDGVIHFGLKGEWMSLFERLLARCVNYSNKVYITHARTGQVVPQLWMWGQSSSHGVSWGKYYADKKRRKKVFSYRWNCRC